MLRTLGILVSLTTIYSLGGGCGDKEKKENDKPAVKNTVAAVEGLDAIPASATTVVGIDVAKLSKSEVVGRAIERMFARSEDKTLQADFSAVLQACKIDIGNDLQFATIAIVPREKSPLDDALLVAKGKFDENAIQACIGRFLAERGGTLESSEHEGRRIYHESFPETSSEDGRWLTFGSIDTLLVSSGRSLLLAALGKGEKLTGSKGNLSSYLPQAKADAGIWAIYQIDGAVAEGLIAASQGQLGPAKAAVAYAEFDDGLRTEIQVEMANESDAKSMISMVSAQLSAAAMILQIDSAGRLIQKIEVSSKGSWAKLSWALTEQEFADLLGSNLLGSGSTIDIPDKKTKNPALAPASEPGAESDTKNGNQHTDPDSKTKLREQGKAHQ